MKVLLITDNHVANSGGAENYFFTLKNELKKRSIEVYSLGLGSKKAIGEDYIVLNQTFSKKIHQLWRLLFHPLKYYQLRQAIKKIQPDIIHLHTIRKYTPTLFKVIKKFPVIQTVHDFTPLCPTGWNLHTNLQPCPTGAIQSCLW